MVSRTPNLLATLLLLILIFFFFQAEDGIRDRTVTGVQTCALPISARRVRRRDRPRRPAPPPPPRWSAPPSGRRGRPASGQIGRASCRERVSVSGVGVA